MADGSTEVITFGFAPASFHERLHAEKCSNERMRYLPRRPNLQNSGAKGKYDKKVVAKGVQLLM